MPKNCKKCGTAMLPADDMDSEKARWICPECAPDFALLRATTYTDIDVPSDQWNEKYQ